MTPYVAIITSIIEFGSIVWNPIQVGLVNKLERVQKRFVRMVRHEIGMAGQSSEAVFRTL